MIRLAEPHDRLRAVELLRAFCEAGRDVFPVTFDPAYAVRLFDGYSRVPDRLALVLDVAGAAQGILLAHAFEHDFDGSRCAQERLWWIDPDHRGPAAIKMLDGYEAWARDHGCRFIGMAGLGASPDVGRLYERRGYRAAETHYLKAL